MKALHKLRWKLIRTHDRGHPKQAPITNPGHGAKRRGCAKFMESNALFRPRCKTASGLQRSASEVEVASGHTHRSRMANSMLVAGKVVKLQQRPITAGNCRHGSRSWAQAGNSAGSKGISSARVDMRTTSNCSAQTANSSVGRPLSKG